jgi:hypothetical protein
MKLVFTIAPTLLPCVFASVAISQPQKVVPMKEVSANPAVIEIQMRADSRARVLDRIREKDDPGVHLGIKGAVLVNADKFPKSVRVFLNMPKATAATSIEDSHYVGTIAFGARRLGAYPFSRDFNVGQVLRKLDALKELDSAKPFTITLIAMPESLNPVTFRIDEVSNRATHANRGSVACCLNIACCAGTRRTQNNHPFICSLACPKAGNSEIAASSPANWQFLA